jgi:hypothetical protein
MRRGRIELGACLDLDQPQPRAGEQLVPLARGWARLKPSHQLPQLHHPFVLWKHLVPKLAVEARIRRFVGRPSRGLKRARASRKFWS